MPTPSYPSYQHLTPLVNTFKARLDSFLDTFGWWARAKESVEEGDLSEDRKISADNGVSDSPDKINSAQAPAGSNTHSGSVVFAFEGEYSIVSPREDMGELGVQETWKRVESVVKEIGRVTGLKHRYLLQLYLLLALENANSFLLFIYFIAQPPHS
jgi:hypothetical protein